MKVSNKILLVDDEPDFRTVMEKFFNHRELACAAAANCAEALALLDEEPFDVVIMDISMPGLNGLECMEKMKALHPFLEVIILTGHASVHGGLIGMKKGAFDYCLKPVDFGELLEKVLLAREKVAGKK